MKNFTCQTRCPYYLHPVRWSLTRCHSTQPQQSTACCLNAEKVCTEMPAACAPTHARLPRPKHSQALQHSPASFPADDPMSFLQSRPTKTMHRTARVSQNSNHARQRCCWYTLANMQKMSPPCGGWSIAPSGHAVLDRQHTKHGNKNIAAQPYTSPQCIMSAVSIMLLCSSSSTLCQTTPLATKHWQSSIKACCYT